MAVFGSVRASLVRLPSVGRETSQTTPKPSMHLGAFPLATPANVRLARSGSVFGVVPGKAHRNIGKQPI